MDLSAIASQNGLSQHVAAVLTWTRDLQSSAVGSLILRNIRDEDLLPRTKSGKVAVCELIRRVSTRPPTNTPTPWLNNLLSLHGQTFLCQSRLVAAGRRSAAQCRVTTLDTVRRHLVRDVLKGDEAIIPSASQRAADQDRLPALFDQPAILHAALDPNAVVRGRLPVVFATPEADRPAHWPQGTPVRRVLEVLGLMRSTGNLGSWCVLHFSLDGLPDRARMPSGLDAHDHKYFMAARWTDRWGWTRDLGAPSASKARGVRECVLPPFPASHITGVEPLKDRRV